jgi:hypothetical protein
MMPESPLYVAIFYSPLVSLDLGFGVAGLSSACGIFHPAANLRVTEDSCTSILIPAGVSKITMLPLECFQKTDN